MTRGVYTSEQMTVLMMVAGSDRPIRQATELRARWRYILGLAMAAQVGMTLDDSFPQVVAECQDYERRAVDIITVLDEWLAEARKV